MRTHRIEIDRARLLVDVRILDMPSPEDAGWIGEEVRRGIRTLGPMIGRHATLYDCSALQVVPAATVEAVRASFVNPAVAPLRARRIAFTVSTMLGRRQAQRVRDVLPMIAIFENREHAIAWLLAND